VAAPMPLAPPDIKAILPFSRMRSPIRCSAFVPLVYRQDNRTYRRKQSGVIVFRQPSQSKRFFFRKKEAKNFRFE
jgi:hypothetical protein